MIVALLLAASSLHAQVISPVLGRTGSSPVVLPAVASLSPLSNAALMTPPPSLSLAPSAVPLAALPVAAAVEGPAPVSPLSALGRAASPEKGDRAPSLNHFWDGLAFGRDFADAPAPLAFEPGYPGADTARTAPWLSVRDARLARALDAAVNLARGTAVGRRAFAAAEKAVGASGGVLAVDVRDLGKNYGEYDYLDGRLSLHRALFEPGREGELAGTLVHELLHVAQHAAGLPSYALELEIEAHLQDLELMAELGLTPPPHTFARQALDALAKGPAAFVELISNAVPGSPCLVTDSLDDVIDQLEQDLESALAGRGRRSAKLARAIEADLLSLRTKEGAAAYRAFSRRVRALLERRSAEVKG